MGLVVDSHSLSNNNLVLEDVQLKVQTKAFFELQLLCFRLFRFLFSIEKNRQVFKVLFPPRIFSIFIDIGNFVRAPSKYQALTEEFNRLSAKEVATLQKNLQNLKKSQSAQDGGGLAFGAYQVVDLLGKGAFGSVYQVRKGENLYALKNI